MTNVRRENYLPTNLIAGDYPVATAIEKVKVAMPIAEHTVVALKSTGIEAASASNLADIYGITASAAEGGKDVVVYLTGEFRKSAVTFPEGAEADKVKTPLRKLGIFLK